MAKTLKVLIIHKTQVKNTHRILCAGQTNFREFNLSIMQTGKNSRSYSQQLNGYLSEKGVKNVFVYAHYENACTFAIL